VVAPRVPRLPSETTELPASHPRHTLYFFHSFTKTRGLPKP